MMLSTSAGEVRIDLHRGSEPCVVGGLLSRKRPKVDPLLVHRNGGLPVDIDSAPSGLCGAVRSLQSAGSRRPGVALVLPVCRRAKVAKPTVDAVSVDVIDYGDSGHENPVKGLGAVTAVRVPEVGVRVHDARVPSRARGPIATFDKRPYFRSVVDDGELTAAKRNVKNAIALQQGPLGSDASVEFSSHGAENTRAARG